MDTTATSNRRRHERVFSGMPMEFNGCSGNALDVNEIALFLVLPNTCPMQVGQTGVLKFTLDGVRMEEKVSVARVTKTGVSLVSTEEVSTFPRLMGSLRSGVKFVKHTASETAAHFRGEFSADFWDDFVKIYQGKEHARRYRLNFTNVTSMTSSGLAMLLHLDIHNQGEKESILISHCNKEVLKSLAPLHGSNTGIVIVTNDLQDDESHKFKVSTVRDAEGHTTVTIRIAPLFDYNCRNHFAKIYRGRSGKTDYILDFQDTVHIGKAAFGTMLLLNQHNREHQGRSIRIIHCNPSIRGALDGMKFDTFFEFI
ncbi:MAG: hypothetical protein HQL91_01995 [Magnetococcales bacterium]|nr:hypothetical protein [Magnetococcales bacterium]